MLNDAFCRWLKQNRGATVRDILPIVAEGNTVAIHVWFEQNHDKDSDVQTRRQASLL